MIEHRNWRYLKASIQGTSHCLTNTPCQDWAIAQVLHNAKTSEEILVLAASDGAGSAARAEEGARLACLEFADIVSKYLKDVGDIAGFTQTDGENWIGKIADALAIHADECELTLRDFACTLLAAVVSREHAICLQIGDGAIVVGNKDGYSPAFWPQSGEYANSTYFITDKSAIDQLQFITLPNPVDEIALLTDGLQMLALHYATRTAHAPFFLPMFARLRVEPSGESKDLNEALIKYLNSTAINERTDDDKMLILATRLSESVMYSPSKAGESETDVSSI